MAITIGVTLMSDTLVQSVDVEHKADEKPLMNKDGTYATGRVIDDQYNFTVKGVGDASPVAVGDNTGAPSNVSGGTIIITSTKLEDKNDDWKHYEYSGVCHPNTD